MKWSPPSALTVHELYKSPLTLWHGAFLKPVSSLENVNKRQGNISSLEACTQTTETSWTGRLAHGEGKLSLGGLSQDHAGIKQNGISLYPRAASKRPHAQDGQWLLILLHVPCEARPA